jgi:diacylglycerol kinase family enzyme
MRYFFILNPGSKAGSSRRLFDKIFNILDKAEIKYDYRITASLEDAYSFSKTANTNGYDVIAAVGGDGTINRVLSGFFESDGTRVSNAKMGVVYTGTSPDFCKSYGIPTDVEKAVKVLIENSSRRIHVGKIVLARSFSKDYERKPVGYGQTFNTRYFACCANIGLGAALARRANSGVRGIVGDYAGTFIALLKTLFCYRPCDFQVIVDGKHERLQRVHNISIGRTFYIASGIKVKNDIKQNDGRFYRLTVKNMGLCNCLSTIYKVYSGKQIKDDGILALDYIKKIEILGNNNNPEVEFDGDPGGFLPCSIEIADSSLELICEKSRAENEYLEEKITLRNK